MNKGINSFKIWYTMLGSLITRKRTELNLRLTILKALPGTVLGTGGICHNLMQKYSNELTQNNLSFLYLT